MDSVSLKDLDLNEGYVAVIDKPYEWTSADVVRKIKFQLRKCGYPKIKIGHAGTLDPLATGILLVCIGRATKQVERLQADVKEYVAELELGATTPSGDMEHEIDQRYPTEHITRERVEQALRSLTGEREQLPPLYSAKKVQGVRAYEFARLGEEIELKKALINIYALELVECNLPHIKIRVECSKGTYIRSLAFEIGEALESGAYLKSLRRTRNGGYTVEHAHTLDQFMEKLHECETK